MGTATLIMQMNRNTLGGVIIAAMALTGVVAYAAPATAQTYNYGNPGVANVSIANGSVIIVRADSGAQVAAAVNAPLVPGDYLATGSGSNAEVQFDGTSMLRLSNNTQVRFVNLSPNSYEVQLAAGTVDLAEMQGADGSPQVDTPALTVRPNQTGDYRVTVLGNGETLVTVRSGAATIATANGSQTLSPGGTLIADGSSIRMQNAIGFDSFDQFNISRDQAVVSAYNSNPYLSPQLAGSSNLANYGQWQNVPGSGYAWAPNNQSQTNFAPYQNGQWVWEPGYGYTWVDNAPTGYTTSHYGTWFNNPSYGGWLWQPPASQSQNSSTSLAATWLPAVVSFFLTGSNGSSLGGLGNLLGGLTNSTNLGGLSNSANLSGLSGILGNSSNANIGWIPLSPGEQYQPWYGQNSSYPSTSVTNVTNVTNIYNTYSNARYYRGITMVPVSAWRNGNFRHLVVLRPQQLKQIVLIRGAVPVVPTTANLHYTSVATVKQPVLLSRTFTASRFAAKAPVETRISFKTQQAQIQSIASARPKVMALPPHPVIVAHPVYVPVMHAPIHLTVIKPVTHGTIPVAKAVTYPGAPVLKHATNPKALVVKPVRTAAPFVVVKPVTNPKALVVKPVRTAAPLVVVKHATNPKALVVKPVSTAAPLLVVKPVTNPKAMVVKPVHTAAPLAVVKPTPNPRMLIVKPVRTAAPLVVVKPVHTAAPVLKVAHPAARAAKPVRTPVPVVKAGNTSGGGKKP